MILIAQPRNGSEVGALVMAADSLGWETFAAPTGWRLTDEMIASGKQGCPYGSQTFAEVISQQMNWTLRLNSFDWLARLPFECTGRKVEFMTLGEAMELTETKFIKPADDKVFDAKVYAPGELKKKTFKTPVAHEEIAVMIDPTLNSIIPLDTPTLVSDVVKFVSEYRLFVRDGQVQTCSCYLMGGEINESKNWNRGAEMVGNQLDSWLALDLIKSEPAVIDIGYLDNGDLAVIESNPAWASGIYGCDLNGVLNVLEVVCERGI